MSQLKEIALGPIPAARWPSTAPETSASSRWSTAAPRWGRPRASSAQQPGHL